MALSISDLKFNTLKPDQQVSFSCGTNKLEQDLNEYFCQDAGIHQKEMLSKTYYWTHNDEIIAMVSLLNDDVKLDEDCDDQPQCQYPTYPAVKIGRLGVNVNYRGNRIGAQIINFIKVFFILKNKTGCRYLTVDAYKKPKVLNFYKEHCGFKPLSDFESYHSTRPLYFDLIRLRNAILQDEEVKTRITDEFEKRYQMIPMFD